MRVLTLLCGAAMFAAPASASPVHLGDILLTVEDGRIVTGQIGEDASFVSPVQVFSGEFGDSGFPAFTANPGFDCLAGTFQVGTKIGFDLLEPLQRWDGSEFSAVAEETMKLSFLTLNATTGAGFVPGFELAVQSNGGFHRHYNMFLQGPGGAGGAAPADGVYLLVRSLYSTDPMVGASDPIFLVLGHNASNEEIAEAVAWVESQVLGPACVGDLDGSGAVDGGDLGSLLAAWGVADPAADLDGSGVVDGADLGAMLAAWGACGP